MLDMIQHIDFQILDFIQRTLRTPFFDLFFAMFTRLADPLVIVIYIALLLLIKRTRKDGIMCGCGVAVGALVCNLLLKNIVCRSRPCWLRPEVHLALATPSDYSFPSGHTMAMVIMSVILIHNHPKFAKFLIPFTLLIMYSRLYLYVHFPSDVLFSLIVGSGIGVLTCYLENRISKKRQLSPN